MDLSKLTIPPELFYSKAPSELWKPRSSLVKITPKEIKKEISKKSPNVVHHRKVFNKARKGNHGPILGRVGKFEKLLIKKKVIKKKPAGATSGKENVTNNNNKIDLKPLTKQEELAMLKDIKQKEKELQKKLFASESFKRKRAKGSSFKFFKSKNGRGEDESEASGGEGDLVPGISDYSDKESLNSSTMESLNSSKHESPPKPTTTAILLDPAPFEDDAEPDLDNTTKIIESLLQNLGDGDTDTSGKENCEVSGNSMDLGCLIGTFEGIKPVQQEAKKKTKFMGLGDNQLQIDAGQKKFGLVECKECGFSYNTNVPEDEKIHKKHHQEVTTIPIFRGWAAEEAMKVNEWSEQNGRIIHLHPEHKKMKSDVVLEIINKMEMEFGVQDNYEQLHFYLTVYDSKIVGLAIVKDQVTANLDDVEKPVRLGIQRLFVRSEYRRKGFAKATLKSIAMMHNKGELLDLCNDMAFSSPTDNGMKLIESLIGTDKFLTFSN